MRSALLSAFMLLCFVSTAAALDVFTNLRIEPAAPDERTPIRLFVGGVWRDGCTPNMGAVTVDGNTITVNLTIPGATCPAALMPWSASADLAALPPGAYTIVVTAEGVGLVRRKLAVRESAPAFDIRPNVYASVVQLKAPGLAACAPPGGCPDLTVRFGNQKARVASATSDEIIVVPDYPGPVGPVDVTVDDGNGGVKKVIAGFGFYDGFAPAPPEFFQRVLFPTLYAGPGAQGSDWISEATMRNDSDDPVTSLAYVFSDMCFPVCDSRPQAHRTYKTAGWANGANGAIYTVPRQIASQLHFSLLIRDKNRQSQVLGTEVPVVREEEFSGDPVTLLNVNADAQYRVALRIYSLAAPALVRVDIYRLNDDAVLTGTTLQAWPEGTYDARVAAILDLAAVLPVAGAGPLRIVVTPLTGGSAPIWAFASMTNNDTQHVTLATPH